MLNDNPETIVIGFRVTPADLACIHRGQQLADMPSTGGYVRRAAIQDAKRRVQEQENKARQRAQSEQESGR